MASKENEAYEFGLQSIKGSQEVAPYLKEFLDTFPENKVIFWNDTPEDHKMYNEAIRAPNMDKIKGMLLGGAPYNYESKEDGSYRYVTRQAAFYSRADIIRIIIERHKHEKVDDENYRTNLADALARVCESNCSEIARILLDAKTPIFQGHINIAAEHGSWPVIAEMLKDCPNIDLNAKNEAGNTPLHSAIIKGHKHTVQYLLKHDANPNITTNKGRNAAHLACVNASEEILHLVTQYDTDVSARDNDGKTAAILAAEGGKDICIAILAREGANLDQRDNFGNIPMTVAAGLGHASTVRELINNGASFQVTNNLRYDGLEVACLNKRDKAAAMIMRLHREEDYMEYYLQTCWITWMKLVRDRMTESIKALLDRMVVPAKDEENRKILGVVKTKYLYLNSKKKTPDEEDYEDKQTYFLQRIASLRDEDLAYHGTIRILVDNKMHQFGNFVLGMKIVSFVIFLLALSYSLIQSSYYPTDLEVYLADDRNKARIFTDIIVLVYFIFNCITEFIEFVRVMISTIQDIKSDKKEREREIELISSAENEDIRKYKKKDEKTHFGDRNRESSFLFYRFIKNYFSDRANYFDVSGLLTLFILFILRVTAQPVQWVFATITFFINAIRIFKRVIILPHIGPYSTIIFQILLHDVPVFSALFGMTLLIFTGGYFISLRTPYTSMGFTNASLMEDTDRLLGVDNEVQWVFLSGLRVFVEGGNIYPGEYLYRGLNWLSAFIYLTFLFLTLVVFLNVFIAQISDTYGTFRRKAERSYAWQRLNFVVQLERISPLAFFFRRKKQAYILEQKLTKDTLLKYYGVRTLNELSHACCTKEIDVNETLSFLRERLMAMEDRLFGKKPHS